ncbi:MAG: hypothetical protein VW683_00130 [Betaproteobacteria bacterium]|jgi:hypothetical protein
MFRTRPFNHIEVGRTTVTKRSSTSKYIEGEIYFYNNLIETYKNYFPKIYYTSSELNTIKMEKIAGNTFSDLYTHNRLDIESFISILHILKKFHSVCEFEENIFNPIDINGNYINKILNRRKIFDYSTIDNELTWNKIYEFLHKYEQQHKVSVFVHGDPVFTNIILTYDGKYKFIDPRGKVGELNTIFGDANYDWAKVYQSVIGYDHILAEQSVDKIKMQEFKNVFFEETETDPEVIKPLTASLLYSLIPLHDKHHQKFLNLIYKEDLL